MDIAEAFDAVGGEANATTGKEYTCYYARMLDADLPTAVDVIADMVTSALLDPEEFETERGVILEELAMNDDDPSDVVHEEFAAAVFGDHALGRPIGGTPDTIRAVPRDAVWEHYRRTYAPHELVVTAAGAVDHDALCAQVLDGVPRGRAWSLADGAAPVSRREPAAPPFGALPVGAPRSRSTARSSRPTWSSAARARSRTTSAASPCASSTPCSAEACPRASSRRSARSAGWRTPSTRSRPGYAETGTFGMYAGVRPGAGGRGRRPAGRRAATASPRTGSPPPNSSAAIGQLSGGLVLGLEDSGSRMIEAGEVRDRARGAR